MSEEQAAPEGAAETPVVEAPVSESPESNPPNPQTSSERPSPENKAERDRARAGDLTDTLRKSFDKVLKDRPVKEPVPETGERPRNPDGTFATKTPEVAAQVSVPAPPAVLEPAVVPPAWLQDGAKAEWAKVPEAVRAEYDRRFAEMDKGLNEYRQRMEPLKQYDDMARQSGTTLAAALQQYTGLETLLRQNPAKGFEKLAENLGMDLRKFAEWYVAQPAKSPEQVALEKAREQAEAQMAEARRMREETITNMIEGFKASHPRFDELSDAIAFALNTGKAEDLASAYEYAARLIPAASAAPQTAATPPAVAQTQAKPPAPQTGNPSLYGAPGSNPKAPPAKNVDESIRRNAARLGLSI